MKKNLFYFLLLTINLFYGQSMDEGFNYLEKGNYKAAEDFFNSILISYPTNKTANICYGRAVGLNGNSEKAVKIFSNLKHKFPDDYEIKLNYAESLLWNKQFKNAKVYYKDLVKENPNNFPTILGYANTLSNLKEYKEAINYINKALNIEPKNQNALTSKKYIVLGYAYLKQQNQQYKKSEELLNKNLLLFSDDKETLVSLANLYLITEELDKATNIFNKLYKVPYGEHSSLNGLSLIAHLKGNEKKALEISSQSYKNISSISDLSTLNKTKERYIQALIWNAEYKESEVLINKLIKTNPNENWVLALRATLNIYKSQFKKSLVDYNRLLSSDISSFNGNLGKANTLKALNLIDSAYFYAERTLQYYPNQKDATKFIKDLNSTFTPFSESKISYSFDNGNNKAISFRTALEFPITTKFKILGSYDYRKAYNNLMDTRGKFHQVLTGVSYQIIPNMNLQGSIGIISADNEFSNYSQPSIDILFKIKPLELQNLDIGYKREVQNFNADLLNREIVQNHYYANYNINTNFNVGWFTQYYYTKQNDNNTRNLLFTSLYYNLLKKPILKVGLNYQYISFDQKLPNIYFSPKKFNAIEVFANIIKNEVTTKAHKWFYEVTAASGLQYIENNEQQPTYRFQGNFGYKFSERSLASIYGTHSNIASTTAAGFIYTELGFRFKYFILEKPFFRKK